MHSVSLIKDRIRNYWETSAPTYDLSFGHGLKTTQEKTLWLDLLASNIELERKAKVLDVGCGTGFLSLLLAEQGHVVTGIDLSAEMRAQAAAKAAKARLKADFIAGDAEAPVFPEASFDVIISRHVAWTLPAPEQALENWRRLLAPGGMVVIIDGIWTPRNSADRLRFLLADFLRILQGKFKHLYWTRQYAQKKALPFFGGAEPETVMGLMGELGYKAIWLDPMKNILDHERRFGPLEYRITHGKNRRYLIGGKV